MEEKIIEERIIEEDRIVKDGKIVEEREIIEERIIEEKGDVEGNIIEGRKNKLIKIAKKRYVWVGAILIVLLLLNIYIRSLPMQDHSSGGIPSFFQFLSGGSAAGCDAASPKKAGLCDITTNTWTLGPDLDPWLFERYAQTIAKTGSIPKNDSMRNVPLGFSTEEEYLILPYLVFYSYKLINLFGNFSFMFAADFYMVIMFTLAALVFFFFVREVFSRKNSPDKNIKADIIALISTLFFVVSPVILSRTVAGIPDKQGSSFFFLFLFLYLFLLAWKTERLRNAIIFSVLSGITGGLLFITWGGIGYIYVTLGIAGFVAFLFNKIQKKELIIYTISFFFAFISAGIMNIIITSAPFNIRFLGQVTAIHNGLVLFVIFASVINLLVWNTRISKIERLNKIKLPKQITSLVISVVLGLALILIFLGPQYLVDKLNSINQILFHPNIGRWNITVAENMQPYFKDWISNFGPTIQNIPIIFWLFFISSVMIFKKATNKLKKKDSWTLTIFYVIFLLGIIFSRYASDSIFNGENFISKSFYYVSALLFLISVGYYIYSYYKRDEEIMFTKIEFEYVLLLSLFFLTLFTARSGIRLVMFLAPPASALVGYITVETVSRFFRTKGEIEKVLIGILAILVIVLVIFSFYSYYHGIKNESFYYVPSYYNQQWQKAMQWVRDDTPQNSVFAHWWDYGYWVQSIGDRATVLDGGNMITYWNYLMGRLVLTGDNQKDALDFLYNHNTNYLLIDSSDIGKYGAYSSIGSNKTFDRYSWMGAYQLDDSSTQETQNETTYVYKGMTALDEDLIVNDSGKDVLLPAGQVGVGLIVLPIDNVLNGTKVSQPYVVIGNQIMSQKVNLRYVYVNGKFMDFKTGIPGCAYIFPSIIQQGQGIGENPLGAALFISPRLMRGYFAQKYLLDDPFNNFPNFKLVHDEPNIIIDSLNKQGINPKLPDFVFYAGNIQGPIKIWNITYTGNETLQKKYLDTDASKYLDWQL